MNILYLYECLQLSGGNSQIIYSDDKYNSELSTEQHLI